MVIKYFLVYIGVFLSCSVAFVVVAKNFAQGFASSGKKPVFAGGLSAVAASATAYLTSLFTDHLFTIFWIFAGIFLLLGIIQVQFFHKKYFYSNSESKGGLY
jgi:hypothetical protein